jgi:hypothetical protein
VDFVNQSGFEAGWTWGLQSDGRELMIVVIKATYNLPRNDEPVTIATEQVKLTESDEFTGEPGLTAVLHETDYSHRKLRCDVLLNGSAHSPWPVTQANVRLQIGQVDKSFHVFGNRQWDSWMLSTQPTNPELFTQQSISYDHAYGGTDANPEQPEKVATYIENPVGTGYHPIRSRLSLAGLPLPNTSETAAPIEDVTGKFRPMSFGPIGRNFYPRFKHAGTYDQRWLDHVSPFWPDDFSYAYFQSAPEDQQTEFLQGGETLVLKNLTLDGGVRAFQIPFCQIPVTFLPSRGPDVHREAVCDTLLIEPDFQRFCLTLRVTLPLRRNLFDIKQTIVGNMPYSWHSRRRARAKGKRYYPNLAALIEANRQ